jgi:hypothetical protein
MSSATTEINPAYDEQTGYETADDRYPPDWDARKDMIRKRDDYICQDCGFKSGYHAAEARDVRSMSIILRFCLRVGQIARTT